ncbi:TetR/AcrR family transcriptional regulator [Isoptericola sp. NPDC057191]|uniref:TetR/AcrR family transcriptional regulator n=1 Tax=Isoptericola sp. NPDC057191 TaxID=3346041 RepID=UPI003640C732
MPVPTRRDAARNRERLVIAARRVFTEQGPDAPLETIADTAGVSRTTLHRHFASRAALVSAVLEENVREIEARAAKLAGRDDGAIALFHHLLDVQLDAPWLSRVVGQRDTSEVGDLARRTAEALDPLVARARDEGLTQPSVTTQDVLLALPMAMAARAATTHGVGDASAGHNPRRVRTMLHRGLFTTSPPGG